MHISSSYVKILGGIFFHTREFLRSGSKAKDGEEEEEERLNDGDNNGQAMHGARKHAWRTQAAWANTHGARKHAWRTQAAWAKSYKTRLPGTVPQLIGLFLFCIEFGCG